MSTDRIRVEITGDSKDLVAAAAVAAASIRGVSHEANASDASARRAAAGHQVLGSSIFGVNQKASLLRNTLALLKWPAMIAGAGLAAQALSALGAGAIGVVASLAPLTGLLGVLPGLASAAAQGIGTLLLGTAGIGKALKASLAEHASASKDSASAMKQQRAAIEQVRQAKQGLAQNERQEKVATEDLTQARKDATRQLEDMRQATEDGALSNKRAALSLREARDELARVEANPQSSGTEIADARLKVQEAEQQLKDTRAQTKRARSDYADAERKGVERMPQVVQARRALADANRQVAESAHQVQVAQDAAAAASDQQSASTAKLNSAMGNLSPAAQRFVHYLLSLRDKVQDLRSTAARGLLPGVQEGLQGLLHNFGPIQDVIGQTSEALGGLAAKTGKQLGSDAWGRDIEKIGGRNVQTITRLGDSSLHFADALRHVTVAAGPFIGWLTAGVLHFSKFTEQQAKAGRESGRLAHFFNETKKTMQLIKPILTGIGGALFNIGKAAKPLGDDILRALGQSAQGWKRWTDSVRGRNELKAYFDQAKPAVFESGRLVRDLAKSFFRLGTQPGVATLIRQIRTELLPAIEQLVGTTTSAFGPHLVRALTDITVLFGDLADSAGGLTLAVDAIDLLAKGLHELIKNIPGAHAAVSMFIGGLAVLKVAQVAQKVLWLDKLAAAWKGVGGAAAGAAVAEGTAGAAGAAGAAGGAAASAAAVAKRGEKVTKGGVLLPVGVDTGAQAVAKSGGRLRGFLTKLGPIARRGGLIALGYAAVDGLGAAFSSQYGKQNVGGKLKTFFATVGSDVTLGMLPKPRTVDQRMRTIVQRIQSFKGTRLALNRKGDPDNSIIRKSDLSDFSAGQRRYLTGLATLRNAANRLRRDWHLPPFKVRLDSKPADFKRLKSDLADIHGAYNGLKPLKRQVDQVFDGIAKTMGVNTHAGRVATERAFGAIGDTIAFNIHHGLISTKDGMAQMRKWLTVHSAGGKTALLHNYAAAMNGVEKQMSRGGKVTAQGMNVIHRLMKQALSQLGVSDAKVKGSLKLDAGDIKQLSGKARGGMVQYGRPGEAGRDTIPTRIGGDDVMVGAGEQAAVVNRHQRPLLDQAVREKYGVAGLPGFFRKFDRKHYAASGGLFGGRGSFAGGGFTGPHGSGAGFTPLANFLHRKFGLQVIAGRTDHNANTVNGNPSDHGWGGAIDVSNSTHPTPQMDRASQLVAKVFGHTHFAPPAVSGPPALKQEIYRTNAPGYGDHMNHIHVALQKAFAFGPQLVSKLLHGKGVGAIGGEASLIPRIKVKGHGEIPAGVQGAIDTARKAANHKIAAEAAKQEALDPGAVGSASGVPPGFAGGSRKALGKKMAERFQHGWGHGPEWSALDDIWGRLEGSWNENLANLAGSGAYGIAQALPSSKYPPAGRPGAPAGLKKAAAQIGWGLSYIKDRYGDPIKAHAARLAQGWYERGGLLGMASGGLPGARGSVTAGEVETARSKFVGARTTLARHPKNKKDRKKFNTAKAAYKKLKAARRRGQKGTKRRQTRLLDRLKGLGVPTKKIAAYNALGDRVTDLGDIFDQREALFRSDDNLSTPELNELLGRKQQILQTLGGKGGQLSQAKSISGILASRTKKLKKFIGQIVARVRANMKALKRKAARVKKVRDEIQKLHVKKKKSKHDLKALHRLHGELTHLRRDMPALEGDNAFLTGEARPKSTGSAITDGLLGQTRTRLSDFSDQTSTFRDELRPGGLQAAISGTTVDMITLKREGATKADESGKDDTLAQLLAETRKSLAVSQAQYPTLRDFGQMVGRFDHGTRYVPQTGLAMVHRGEQILTDPEGAYGSQIRRGGGGGGAAGPQVTVVLKGDAAALLDEVEVLVDGKLERARVVAGQRTGRLISAPGRRG